MKQTFSKSSPKERFPSHLQRFKAISTCLNPEKNAYVQHERIPDEKVSRVRLILKAYQYASLQ